MMPRYSLLSDDRILSHARIGWQDNSDQLEILRGARIEFATNAECCRIGRLCTI
jgi:hypothetical protein